MSDEIKKKMKLFGYFTIFNQAHGDLVNKFNELVFGSAWYKLDSKEQKRILDISRRIDELGRLYNDQITDVAELIGDEITSSRSFPGL